MELVTKKRLHLISGRSNLPLAQEIADHLGVQLDEPNLAEFANGEIHCRFSESVRGGDVFIIQSHSATPDMTINDSIMEQLIMVDAARRASAKRITVVCPFYGYARQDRKSEGREPITARLLATLFIAAGVNRMISVDLHSGQIQGFFNIPVDDLRSKPLFVKDLKKRPMVSNGNALIVSPDAGGVPRARSIAKELNLDIAIVDKRRDKANESEAMNVIGNVQGKQCIIVDDIVDTGGTLVKAADALLANGAEEVQSYITHGVLSNGGMKTINKSSMGGLTITDSIPQYDNQKVKVLSVLSLIHI